MIGMQRHFVLIMRSMESKASTVGTPPLVVASDGCTRLSQEQPDTQQKKGRLVQEDDNLITYCSNELCNVEEREKVLPAGGPPAGTTGRTYACHLPCYSPLTRIYGGNSRSGRLTESIKWCLWARIHKKVPFSERFSEPFWEPFRKRSRNRNAGTARGLC
eukprot:GHVU01066675.1.p1 GENE.GHVU01066675.1~~GHVU01066675.1.p1  ORF type:complete len:160 (-),score=7.99 GHVU01066675.1:150-629(-)